MKRAAMGGAILMLTSSSLGQAARNSTATPSSVTVVAGAGLGGGSKRLGPIHVAASLDSHVWLGELVGISAGAIFHSSGAPDSRGAGGHFYSGALSLRTNSSDATSYGFISLGAGLLHNDGYDHAHHIEETSFDQRGLGWSAQAGGFKRGHFLAAGCALQAYGNLDGSLAIMPKLLLGIDW